MELGLDLNYWFPGIEFQYLSYSQQLNFASAALFYSPSASVKGNFLHNSNRFEIIPNSQAEHSRSQLDIFF